MTEQLLLVFGIFFGMLLLQFPVFLALISSLISHYLVFDEMTPVVVSQAVIRGLDNTALTAIPYFFLVGVIMNEGGITNRILRFAQSLVGWSKGGLSQVNVGASILFGGMSGSAAADASAIGSIMIPAMKKDGYSAEYSAAVTASSATIGLLIPPSIPMVMFGIFNDAPIHELFIAGLLPGLLMGVYLMFVCAIIARTRQYNARPWLGFREIWLSFQHSIFALLLPVLLVFSLVYGVATVSEIGAIAVVYALIVSIFVYRDATFKQLFRAVINSAVDSTKIMSIIAVAGGLVWIVSNAGGSQGIATFISNMNLSSTQFLAITACLIVVLGTMVGPGLQMILIVPTLTPLALNLDISILQFGVVSVLASAIGLLTPPVGFLLFLVSSLANTKVQPVIIEVMPFLIALLFLLALLVLYPGLSTSLVSLLLRTE